MSVYTQLEFADKILFIQVARQIGGNKAAQRAAQLVGLVETVPTVVQSRLPFMVRRHVKN